jgi:Phage tail tube protein, GTA-gp10
MANFHRGEVTLTLNGKAMPLRLTLQSLAEIEAAIGGSLSELGSRFAGGALKAGDVIILLGAALRGGGADISDADIAGKVAASELAHVIERLGALFELTFGGQAPNPP